MEIGCAVTDAISGVTGGCEGVAAPAYRFGAGGNTVERTARDRAGNAAARTTSFSVDATAETLCAVARQMVSRESMAAPLCAQFQVIEKLSEPGNGQARDGVLRALENHLNRQSGRHIASEDAAVLFRWAQTL